MRVRQRGGGRSFFVIDEFPNSYVIETAPMVGGTGTLIVKKSDYVTVETEWQDVTSECHWDDQFAMLRHGDKLVCEYGYEYRFVKYHVPATPGRLEDIGFKWMECFRIERKVS